MPNGAAPKSKKSPNPLPPTALSQRKTTPPDTGLDAIALLKQDHQEVDQLFQAFSSAKSDAQKRTIVNEICSALKIHARIEEDLFYPAVFSPETADMLGEARVEHASAKDLIAQIEASAPGELLFDAKVNVLAEYIRHHVAEEEGEIFPLCKNAGADLSALGHELSMLRQELMRGANVSNPILAIPA